MKGLHQIVDLSRVSQVPVQSVWGFFDEIRERLRALIDVLIVVAKDEKPRFIFVSHKRLKYEPPVVTEILSFVNNDQIKSLATFRSFV